MNTCNDFVIRLHQVKVHLIRMVCKFCWQDTSCGVYLIVEHELTIEFSPAKIYCSWSSGSSVVAPNTLCCSESSNQLVICPMCSMLHFNTWNSGPKLHIVKGKNFSTFPAFSMGTSGRVAICNPSPDYWAVLKNRYFRTWWNCCDDSCTTYLPTVLDPRDIWWQKHVIISVQCLNVWSYLQRLYLIV